MEKSGDHGGGEGISPTTEDPPTVAHLQLFETQVSHGYASKASARDPPACVSFQDNRSPFGTSEVEVSFGWGANIHWEGPTRQKTSRWFDRRVNTLFLYFPPLPNGEVTYDAGLPQRDSRLTPINSLTKAKLADLPPAPHRLPEGSGGHASSCPETLEWG